MKLNSYSYLNEVRTFVIYDQEQNEQERTINPYNSKAFFNSVDIYGEPLEIYDDYYSIFVPDLVECKNNPTHIKAKEKKGLIFVVWVVDKYGSVYGALYIPTNAIKSHEIIEEKRDMQGRGCVCVSYNDKIVFDSEKIKIECRDSKYFFAKGSDPIPESGRADVVDLREELEKSQEHLEKYLTLNPEKRAKYIELLKQKIAEGYEYRVSQYRCTSTSANYLILYNCVDHYEKSADYIKLEKLTNQIRAINKHWGEDDTLKLLAIFKLTKKRK